MVNKIIKWVTKNGEELLIKDMETSHIINCIKAIRDGRIQIGETINLGYTADGEGDGVMYDYIDYKKDYIEAFQEELEKRKGGVVK